MRVRNPPLALLAAIALACLAVPFVSHAPNRLMSGIGQPAPFRVILAVPALLLAWGACTAPHRRLHWLALGVACLGLLATWWEAGMAAIALASTAHPAARTMLGGGFWGLVLAFGLAIVDSLQALRARAWLVLAVVAGMAACFAGMAGGGLFGALSLAQEAATHRAAFGAALLRHLLLTGATVGLAIALGAPLGLAIQRRRGWRKPVFAVLGVVQTLPSVAVFGLLIAPLAALGFSGIGVVPALVALVGYALLPVVRQMVAGLDGADASTLDAARGMGMGRWQVLTQIELRLAAPALVAGLRIVVVQTIGLSVVAALIGAGGLGDFVFQGLGQYAVDLVLLGALPAIGLALLADLILRLAEPDALREWT